MPDWQDWSGVCLILLAMSVPPYSHYSLYSAASNIQ